MRRRRSWVVNQELEENEDRTEDPTEPKTALTCLEPLTGGQLQLHFYGNHLGREVGTLVPKCVGRDVTRGDKTTYRFMASNRQGLSLASDATEKCSQVANGEKGRDHLGTLVPTSSHLLPCHRLLSFHCKDNDSPGGHIFPILFCVQSEESLRIACPLDLVEPHCLLLPQPKSSRPQKEKRTS